MKLCGAKTRSGKPCKAKPVWGMVRCRMHGGKSLRGYAHPNYKHGLYSKHSFEGMMKRAELKKEKIRMKAIKTFAETYREEDIDKLLQRNIQREIHQIRHLKNARVRNEKSFLNSHKRSKK